MPRKRSESSSPDNPKRVTLKDIADVVGVHRMTVSDALNGSGSVAPATRERIRQVAREMNYIPNFAARALSTGRTGTIAILSGPMNQPYYANMVHCLEQQITAEGYNLMLMRTPSGVNDLVNATGNVAADGAIAVDMLGLVREFEVHPMVPCVSICTVETPYVDCVIIDLRSGVEAALRLMLEAGRQRIAYYVTSDFMANEAEVRAGTYCQMMRQASREPEIINVVTDDLSEAQERLKAYIATHGCPDAMLCQNDDSAMVVFEVLRDLGYTVPDDVLLVGCDGQLHMRHFNPPLSTIVQPMEEMCAAAWRLLRQRMAQPDLPHQVVVLEGALKVRESLQSHSA
ncbi:LacI family transcriptional regulator [bacterium]|nr:MAG: LacI family transcriptional regulator [bacterium]